MKDTKKEELEKSECANSAITITPIIKLERQKWGALAILQVTYDGVFVCTCKLFSDITKGTASNAFVYGINYEQK